MIQTRKVVSLTVRRSLPEADDVNLGREVQRRRMVSLDIPAVHTSTGR